MEITDCQYGGSLEPPLPDLNSSQLFWCSNETIVYSGNASSYIGACICPLGADVVQSSDTWVLGVLFSMLSSACTAVGTLLQKRAHIINEAKPQDKKAKEFIGILFSPAWLVAFLLMVLLPLPFDFVALALAAQSLLVPFAGLTIVLNQMLAPCMLDEHLTRVEIIATAIILAGLLVSTTTGSKSDTSMNACQLLTRYSEPGLLVPILILSLFMAMALYCIHYQKYSTSRYRPAIFAFLAGGFGGIGNIVFKATGEMAASGLSEGGSSNAWKTIHPYYHIAMIIFFATLQIAHINQGLREFDSVRFIPLYNAAYILLSGSMGGIAYHEFDGYTPIQWVLFPLGIVCTIIGIAVMTQRGAEQLESRVHNAAIFEVAIK